MIFGINTTRDISKLLFKNKQFWNITGGIYANYHYLYWFSGFFNLFFFVWFNVLIERLNRTVFPHEHLLFVDFQVLKIDKSFKEIKLYSIISQLNRFSYGVIQHLDFEGARIFKYLYLTYFLVIISFRPPYSVLEM